MLLTCYIVSENILFRFYKNHFSGHAETVAFTCYKIRFTLSIFSIWGLPKFNYLCLYQANLVTQFPTKGYP